MDATCTIQDSIHVFSLVHKYVSRILGTYQLALWGAFLMQNTERRYMKVIFDEQGNIYYQMMDVAPDPVGGLKFIKIDVPIGKNLIRFDVDGDKIEPIYIDRPLTPEEELKKEFEEKIKVLESNQEKLENKQITTDLALVELSTNLMS